jgi:hypothetical protein
VLVAAMGQGADGRWTALDARALHAHAKTAVDLARCLYRAEPERLTDQNMARIAEWLVSSDGLTQRVSTSVPPPHDT